MTRNITLAIDETVLDEVRQIASRQRTTVNAIVRDYLVGLAAQEGRIAEARKRLRELAETSEARLGSDYKWSRDEIYEERLFPRHKRPDLRGGRPD